jgi:glycosyltransferase involved in cell wall biosynthesis
MLGLGLALRALGATVDFAFPLGPAEATQSLASKSREQGVEGVLPLRRGRGLHPVADLGDVGRLRRFFRERRPDLVHCWHTRDHLLALRARGRRDTPTILRSARSADPPPSTPWHRWLFGPGSDGLLCVSPQSAERCRPLRGGRRVWGRLGAVDLARFRPIESGANAEARRELGLSPDHAVVGIVARAQHQRRFDLLLDAGARLFARVPEARLLVIGRGTKQQEVIEEPAKRLGIRDRVHLAGYRGADFASVLRACDVFSFLVPGSDGHCRALLEALACGIPSVVSPRGALPEIMGGSECGFVVAEQVDALAAAWERLLRDHALRRRCGLAARARAERAFRLDDFAADVIGFYEEVLSGAPL